MADDNLTVEIEEEADANKASAVDQAKEAVAPAAQQETHADPIADLKAQHDEIVNRERARAARAEAAAQTEAQARAAAEAERDAVRTEAADTQLTAVEQALAAAETASDAAESEYTGALEAGDWKKAAAAQRKLADARAEAHSLKTSKADLEIRKAQAPVLRTTERPSAQQQATNPPGDPVESFIGNRTPATQKWLRDHIGVVRDAVHDDRKMRRLGAAHDLALGDGLDVDTPEYFAHVEKTLGITKTNGAAANGATNGKTNGVRRQSAPVAPVAQSAGETQGGGDVVRLTANEAKAAQDGTHTWNAADLQAGRIKDKSLIGQAIGVQEFARRKLAMQKEGRYGSSYYEN